MFAKKIEYTDYDGTTRTETFRFNLTEAELMNMELTTEGGLQTMIQEIIDTKDTVRIAQLFKKIIHMSYGEKSPDGRRFIKSEELAQAFEQTPAYSILYMSLLTDEKEATAFVNGLVPQVTTSAIPAPANK